MVELPSLNEYLPKPVLIGLIIVISVMDIYANVLSVVPVVGTFASAVSESALEGIQVLLVLVLGDIL